MPAREEGDRAALGPLLGRTARAWRRAIDEALQPFGLTEATWRPLIHLARATRPMQQKDLADSLGLDRSAVVRLLDMLEAAGLVERQTTEGDRRSWTIAPTRTGTETAGRVEAAATAVRVRATAGIPAADLLTTARVLDQIRLTLADGA